MDTVLISKESIKGTSLEFKWDLLVEVSMRNKTPVEELMYRLSSYYGIPVINITSKSRKRELVNIRIIYSYLASKILPMDLNESSIAIVLRRDRSSVYHYYECFIDVCKTNVKFKESVIDFVESNYPDSLDKLLINLK